MTITQFSLHVVHPGTGFPASELLKHSHRKSHKTGSDGGVEGCTGEDRKMARKPVSRSLEGRAVDDRGN